MAEKATIQLELPHRKHGDTFESNKVELAGFRWHVSGSYMGTKRDGVCSLSINDTRIDCTPIGAKKTLIWNCEAFGQFVVFTPRPAIQRAKLWSSSFNFRHLTSEPAKIDFQSFFPEKTDFLFGKSGNYFYRMDVQLNAFSHKMIDLSDRDNPMIESADDAAEVKVGETTMYLSKSILSASSHFFKAFFNSDLKEKCTGVYELKEIDLGQFLHFVSLLYGLRVRIDGDSVEYLLKLADYFQCDVISDRCRDGLLNSDNLSREKMLKLADQYKFFDVVAKLVQKMDAVELKNCAAVAGFSLPTCEMLCKRLDEFVEMPQLSMAARYGLPNVSW